MEPSLGPRPNGRRITSPLLVSRLWRLTRSSDVIHPQVRPLGLGPRLDGTIVGDQIARSISVRTEPLTAARVDQPDQNRRGQKY